MVPNIKLNGKMDKQASLLYSVLMIAVILFSWLGMIEKADAETFKTINDEVVIEAEKYTRLGGSVGGSWSANTAIAGYQGAGYIQSASDDPTTLSYSPNTSRVEYDINFTSTGTYYLHLRTYAQDASQNGFFATLNGQEIDYGHPDAFYVYVQKFASNPRWWWYTDGGGARQRGLQVSFEVTSVGLQTFAITRRDKSSRIDHIWITQNQSTPQNVGSLNLPDPADFIVSGLDVEVCDDLIDNDGDGFVDCQDNDCNTDPLCSGPESNCGDGIDNDGDGLADCQDSDCSTDPLCLVPGTILSAQFNSGVDGFAYADDDFRGTGNPAYASGDYDANGGLSGGGLHVTLGGLDSVDVFGMSGGWQADFTLAQSAQVQISLNYRLLFPSAFEPDECGQALVAVDGILQSPGTTDYLTEFCGTAANQDTGWQQATINLSLSAGTHTITVGAYGNKKTGALEVIDAYFDNILITSEQQAPPETLCGDGLDNDGDGQTDCQDSDCSTDPLCTAPESQCGDGLDNDGDGQTDCQDSDCSSDPLCSAQQTILSVGFDSGTQGFSYADDHFRGTGNPAYASGNYDANGGLTGGGVHVSLGGLDGADIFGMSGGWQTSFTLTQDALVQFSLNYRLLFPSAFEPDECGQALVSVNGALQSPGASDFLAEFCGTTSNQDTGWQSDSFSLSLTAGTHTISVGAYGNKKTGALEVIDAYFDNILITTSQQQPPETQCGDGLDNDGDGQTDCQDSDCAGDPLCIAPESQCGDGLDNDGDGQIDCQDSDCSTDPLCTAPESQCGDGLDNDGDGQTDCQDSDCSADPLCSAQQTLLSTQFDSGADGFAYADDEFRSTGNPAYASGSYDANGGLTGGGLEVTLGGLNGVDVFGMSGGWQNSFTLSQDAVVRISLNYRLLFPSAYESDECGQALVAVDGVLYAPGPMDYLEEFCGSATAQDTGWRPLDFELALTAGTHTISVGAFNNKKTGALEITRAFFDNIVITTKDINLQYLESFNNGTANGWTIVNNSGQSSDWFVSNNRFRQDIVRVDGYTQSYHTGSYAYYNNGFGWTDIEAHATLKSLADPSQIRDSIGLMFRYVNANNYYRLIISRMQGFARLEKRTAGNFSTLAFDGRGFEPGQDIKCRVIASGSKILVYVNEVALFSGTDPDHGAGSVALFTQGPAEFDDVYITELSAEPKIVIQNPVANTVAITGGTAGPYTLNVSAIGLNIPGGHGARFILDGNMGGAITTFSEPYTGAFNGVNVGDHDVTVQVVNGAGQPLNDPAGLDEDTNDGVAVGGNYLVAMGDSITNGVKDHILQDNVSSNDKIAGRGYTPILTTLISSDAATTKPVIVFNEGIGGQTSVNGKNNIDSVIIERHPSSEYLIVLYGSNDAAGSMPTQSGSTCSEADLANGIPSCTSTFKANIRQMILTAQTQGMTPILVKVPYRGDVGQTVLDLIQEYNIVIDQLNAEHSLPVVPADLYAYFLSNVDQLDADLLHPDGDGYDGIGNALYINIMNSGILN